jgi:Raf kinase inhibitor-like YbhB/YbcL family protein
MTLPVTSPAFAEGQPIPARFTCTDQDVSPALAWTGAPTGTRSFALICDDPDAPMGTWVHWVIFNIPADSTGLPEGVPRQATLPDGAVQGRNSWKKTGYGGPCPPPGKPHRYFFKLYALDAALALDADAGSAGVEAAMKGHVLAEGRLMGTYRR